MQQCDIAEVAIIGNGPAGIAAAIQLNKYCLASILLFSKPGNCGLLANARIIENYPGFPNGISGVELWNKFYTQLSKNNVKQIFVEVSLLDFIEQDKLFAISTNKQIYYAKYVVVASGTKAKQINLANIAASQNVKIYYDVLAIMQQQDRQIAIIGAGDAAFDFALSLAITNKINIYHRSSHINASFMLQKDVAANNNISCYNNTSIVAITTGAANKQHLTLQQQQNIFHKDFDYVVAAIGRVANKEFYTDKLKKLEKKLIKNKLLFLAGDVKNNIYRQVAIAVSDGVLAAIKIKEQFVCK